MIGESTVSPLQSDAKTIESLAAEWFGRRQFWNWSDADQGELDAWLVESLAHQVAYWRLVAAWERTERLNAIHEPMQARRERRQFKSGWPRISLLVAATAAALVVAVWSAQRSSFRSTGSETYSTAVGEMKTITLADGSSIDLNTNTSLDVSLRGGARSVRLRKGEAYFQVRHDAARPFTVVVGDHRVTDLGTKFLVRDDRNSIRVSLIEGRAQLESIRSADAHSVILAPGDVAVASSNSLSINRKPSHDLSERLGWRAGVLIFSDATLGDAAAEFNRYNKVQLKIADPAVARMPIAGKFPTNGVDRFADLIEHVFGLQVRDQGNTKIISR